MLQHGNTVLHEAAWNGFSRCVKVLCNDYPKADNANKEKLGWKKNHFINRVNFCGFTALHLAAQNGHNQTTRELLYAGCSHLIQNDYGDTPIHTACRYGHAGVVRILISAKCDVNAFNLNHDTPLHITCAMGRRKLTKLLLATDAMQFQNLQSETPIDIARRKSLTEIIEIMTFYKEKLEKKMIRDTCNRKSPTHVLTHNSKLNQCNIKEKQRHWSPYGCHYYPDTRNFPSPKLESLPTDPLEKGEQYYLDLGGNIRKGPVGRGNKCYCVPFDKNGEIAENCRNAPKIAGESNMKIDLKLSALVRKFEKTARSRHHHLQKSSRSKSNDPLYPLLKIVGDKNKQLHLKQWLHKVYPDKGSNSDLQQLSQKSITIAREISADVHQTDDHQVEDHQISRSSSKRMPEYDENGNQNEDDDEQYTDISNESEGESGNGSTSSNNGLYDEGFLRNFQYQQHSHHAQQNDSLSTNSNQNIQMEMKTIAKSLQLNNEGSLMVNRKPDVIRDLVHHSAKRSTKKIKSAINMPNASNAIASGELYVNSFFKNDSESRTGGKSEVDNLVSNFHRVIVNSSNASDVSSLSNQLNAPQALNTRTKDCIQKTIWNQSSRSRNPLPINIDEIEENSGVSHQLDSKNEQITTSFNENNFVLLNQLMKARKKFNFTYQQQLEIMNQHDVTASKVSSNQKPQFDDSTIPSSSTLV